MKKDEGRTKDLETLEGRLADLNREAQTKNQTTVEHLVGLLRDAMEIIAGQNRRLGRLEAAGLNSGLGQLGPDPLDPKAVERLEQLGDKLDDLANPPEGFQIDAREILKLQEQAMEQATTPEERAGVAGIVEAWYAKTFHDTTLGEPHQAGRAAPVS